MKVSHGSGQNLGTEESCLQANMRKIKYENQILSEAVTKINL